MKSQFLRNKLAVSNFIILIISFIILHSVALFFSSVYWRMNRNEIPTNYLHKEISDIANVANTLTPEQYRAIQRVIRHRGFRMRLESQAMSNSTRLFPFDTNLLQQTLKSNPNDFKISFELNNGKWLNITSNYYQPTWLLIGLYSVGLLLVIMLVAVCYWIIKRMLMPLEQFTEAVNRFGRDVNAPPLPVTGPESFQAATNAFNDMQSRIRQLLNDRTQMLAAISHDLRTPITRLKLRSENVPEPDHQKMFNDLTEMEQMINSILSFARDYTRDEAVERFDIKALLETICDEMVDIGKNVSFTTVFSRLPVSGRTQSLKRALTNVIDNAVKYGKQAQVSLDKNEQEVLIKITDQGPGIPEDELNNVFRPFYRLDPSRSPKTAGSGLGLSVARDIVLAHGGSISLANQVEKGLTVIIKLPI